MNKAAKEQLRQELMSIYTANDNLLPPQVVVDWARANPESELHKHLEWNDGTAAEAHRRFQVRQIVGSIRIEIETPAGPRQAPMFVSLEENRSKHKEGGGYSLTADVLNDDERKAQMLAQALRELNLIRARYSELQELAVVFDAVDAVKGEAA